MNQVYIFDMDGTMVDNMMVHHRAWQRKLAALGLPLTLEEVRLQIHGINEEIIERLFGNLPILGYPQSPGPSTGIFSYRSLGLLMDCLNFYRRLQLAEFPWASERPPLQKMWIL